MANLVEQSMDIAIPMESYGPLAIFAARNNFSFYFAEQDPLARSHLAAGVYQRSPGFGVLAHRFYQQHFNLASQVLAATPAHQPRGNHSRIIQHQTVVRTQEFRKLAEHPIFPAPFFAIQNQHSPAGAVRERRLRDALLRQVIIKLEEIQTSQYQ